MTITPPQSAVEESVVTDDELVVGVLTFRRPEQVCRLLRSLTQQLSVEGISWRVLVVDNDPQGSAQEPIAQLGLPRVDYVVEPSPGIAHARNRVLDEAADARFVVFIDDDELPVEGWLRTLIETQRRYDAELVAGPVIPEFSASPQPWVLSGGYFRRPRFATGALMPAAGTGNLLLDRNAMRKLGDFRFDPDFGLTGGSDTLFTRQVVAAGGRIVWADEAEVVDVVPVSRMTRTWVRQRAFRGGNCWGRCSVVMARTSGGRFTARVNNAAQGLARVLGGSLRYVAATLRSSDIDRAQASRTVWRGAGLMSTSFGYVYTEYKRPRADRVGLTASVARRAPRWTRSAYRRMRKTADNGFALVWLGVLRIANRWSRRQVTGNAPVTVSLTSYGARIDSVAYTIESIAWGRVRPRRLVLWIDDADRFSDLPPALRRLIDRGLEVLPTENFGPHTKYYPLVVSTVTDQPFVTADDDVLYPPYWLDRLTTAAREHPDVVNCYRASDILVNVDALAPYSDWPRCTHTRPGSGVFATGVAGVLYPASMMAALRAAGSAFMESCPLADDIWLHHVALRAGVSVRQIHRRPRHFWTIRRSQKSNLMSDNVQGGRNDRYISALYTEHDVAALQGTNLLARSNSKEFS